MTHKTECLPVLKETGHEASNFVHVGINFIEMSQEIWQTESEFDKHLLLRSQSCSTKQLAAEFGLKCTLSALQNDDVWSTVF